MEQIFFSKVHQNSDIYAEVFVKESLVPLTFMILSIYIVLMRMFRTYSIMKQI